MKPDLALASVAGGVTNIVGGNSYRDARDLGAGLDALMGEDTTV